MCNVVNLQVSFTKGEVVKGTVVQFEPTGALVDIGSKATAYMPAREVRKAHVSNRSSSVNANICNCDLGKYVNTHPAMFPHRSTNGSIPIFC